MVIEKQYYVYIMTNAKHTTLYTGFSNDLKARVWSHKGRFILAFRAILVENMSEITHLTIRKEGNYECIRIDT